jgi:hypothetical protein
VPKIHCKTRQALIVVTISCSLLRKSFWMFYACKKG